MACIYPFAREKVVSALEMRRIEQKALCEGQREDEWIAQAGQTVARIAQEMMGRKTASHRILLLIGKGNKGADAYAAGKHLAEAGFRVFAQACFPTNVCSAMNRRFQREFLARGGVLLDQEASLFAEPWALVIDGLLGTGFHGALDNPMRSLIAATNRSGNPILAIDIPSGLDGTTGKTGGNCIRASATAALGYAKQGLFSREGWDAAGRLWIENIGLSQKALEEAQETFRLLDPRKLSLPVVHRARHKYEAGYVVGVSGSKLFRGAPKLAGLAALRFGAGIVRVFHREEIGEAPMELICEPWSEKRLQEELARARALFIGPGLGVSFDGSWLEKVEVPTVLDADLLRPDLICPRQAILTPHRGELARLLGMKEQIPEPEIVSLCQDFVEKRRVVLVLKGAPTFIFSHETPPLAVPWGDPGMATAGAGDVLTGGIAALLAQGLGCYEAAALGVYLHAAAGEEAAAQKSSWGMIASDLIECLPLVFRRKLAERFFVDFCDFRC